MKVAILVPNYVEYSGDARVAQYQTKELIEKGHSVSVFALAADMGGNGARIFVMGMPKNLLWQRVYRLLLPLNLLLLLRWIPKLRNYDVVIAHLYPMTWIAYLARKIYHNNYVFWFHGVEDHRIFPNFYERIYMRLHLALTYFTIRNANRIVSVSNFAKKTLKEFTGLDSEVIYNKVDLKRFHRGVNGRKMRQRLNLGDAPVFLFVGRLAPQKGIHLLIQAFGIIREKYPTAKLVLAGDPTFKYYIDELKSVTDDAVIFVGHVSTEEIPYYYGMCDVYTTCSLWENHNLPVLEAQTCGKPIVAFDIEAFQEVASPDDMLVEKGNVDKFAEACIEIIKRTRKDIA